MTLFTATFWRAILWALVRTVLAGVVPFLPGLTSDPAGTLPVASLTVGLLLIVTVATSLAGIVTPEDATWWELLVSRGLRQFGQYVAAGLLGAVMLTDVSWLSLLQGAAASALSTVVLAALTVLPAQTVAPTVAAVPVEVPTEIGEGI